MRHASLRCAAVGLLALGCGGQGETASTADASREGSESVDSAVPEASPADCGLFPIAFPDAAMEFPDGGEVGPSLCALTAADVACDASADCVPWTSVITCGVGCGVLPVIGVNHGGASKVNAPTCPRPLCPAPQGPAPVSCGPDSGLETQDCKLVHDRQHVAIACVSGQCMASGVQ
jgi:hypothetical protein